jgi:hypothetical protein
MITELRTRFNREFTQEKYQAMINEITKTYNHRPLFSIAETPVFIPKPLKYKLFEACEDIMDVVCRPDFKKLSETALQAGQEVPNEDDHTTFLQMDFGICKDANGELTPQLIEIQGFPTLYFYQDMMGELYKKHFNLPDNLTHLFGGISPDEYVEMLRRVIVGDADPKQVVLLEVEPHRQVTQIDYWVTAAKLGIAVKCVSDLIKEGNKVFYKDENGKKIRVERIYNRVIFDELVNYEHLQREFRFVDDADVHWVGHPNWFFRISKHTLPLLDSQYVPKSYFLDELNDNFPDDLHNYVLKPLFSFAGTGVIVNISKYDLQTLHNSHQYILQRKVKYEDVVETLDEPAKCEVRMLMLWEKGQERPRIINNLVRLSKAEMIGVRYNRNKTWVGGSIGLFEKE